MSTLAHEFLPTAELAPATATGGGAAIAIGIRTGWAAIAVAACLMMALRILSHIIYNIFFHPYARYPGPFLAKFTDLYAGYHAWRGDLHVDMWRCHQKYGPKVRYAPNRLNVNTVTGLRGKYLGVIVITCPPHEAGTKADQQQQHHHQHRLLPCRYLHARQAVP